MWCRITKSNATSQRSINSLSFQAVISIRSDHCSMYSHISFALLYSISCCTLALHRQPRSCGIFATHSFHASWYRHLLHTRSRSIVDKDRKLIRVGNHARDDYRLCMIRVPLSFLSCFGEFYALI